MDGKEVKAVLGGIFEEPLRPGSVRVVGRSGIRFTTGEGMEWEKSFEGVGEPEVFVGEPSKGRVRKALWANRFSPVMEKEYIVVVVVMEREEGLAPVWGMGFGCLEVPVG